MALQTGFFLLALLQIVHSVQGEESVATVSVKMSEFNVDKKIFTCSKTSVSYKTTDGMCYLLQRFCLGSSTHVGLGDTILCSTDLYKTLSTMGVYERRFTVKPGKIPIPPVTGRPLRRTEKAAPKHEQYRNCSNASLCYPYTMDFDIPASMIVRAPRVVLYVVLAEIDWARHSGFPRIVFRNSFEINIPKVAGGLPPLDHSRGVRTRPQHVCVKALNTFLLDLKQSVLKLFQKKDQRQLVQQLFDVVTGLWKPEYGEYHASERDSVDPDGRICIHTDVRMKCKPGFGPPGDCSYKVQPCRRAAAPHDDINDGGAKRLRRGVVNPARLPCASSKHMGGDELSTGDKVTIGLGAASTSLVLGALVVCVKKVLGMRTRPTSSGAADAAPNGEELSNSDSEIEVRARDYNTATSDLDDSTSDLDLTDAYETIHLKAGRFVA